MSASTSSGRAPKGEIDVMGQQQTSRPLSHAREIAVTFNRELPIGRAEVPSIDGSVNRFPSVVAVIAGGNTMTFARRRFLRLAAGAAALPAASSIARAQTYPSRPITIVVGFAAGASTDTIGRVIAERMKSSLGQPVIVEDVTGAGGTIAAGRVARAAPNGYTLSLGNNTSNVMAGAAYALQYDLLNDFEPVALLSTGPFVLTARKAMPANDLKGLIAWLKANPDKATPGNVDISSPTLIAGFLFQRETGTRLQFVPYPRGAAPAIQDLVAGQIDMAIADPVVSLPQVRAGTIKAFGVTTKTRVPSAPDIPTLDEAGLPGFDISQWFGLWLPKGTPKNIIAKLNAAVIEALADPVVRARLADFAQETIPRAQQTPEALGALQKAEIEKWWPIAKAAKIKGE
jgi:tripartite-type tricarboxylate transporter receptor subunit TctC